MFTFCGYLYIFIRTSSYKQKHDNILILCGGIPSSELKKSLNQQKIFGDSLGRAPWRKPNKNRKTKKKKKPNPLEILQS
jgi:hypothetical protein